MKEKCFATRRGSQIYCTTCTLTWDADDPNPPDCNPRKRQEAQPRKRAQSTDWAALKEAVKTGDFSKFE